jgi:hypothetical protein
MFSPLFSTLLCSLSFLYCAFVFSLSIQTQIHTHTHSLLSLTFSFRFLFLFLLGMIAVCLSLLRFLNNPDSVTGFAGYYGLALMCPSWVVFWLAVFSQVSNFIFVKTVEAYVFPLSLSLSLSFKFNLWICLIVVLVEFVCLFV